MSNGLIKGVTSDQREGVPVLTSDVNSLLINPKDCWVSRLSNKLVWVRTREASVFLGVKSLECKGMIKS